MALNAEKTTMHGPLKMKAPALLAVLALSGCGAFDDFQKPPSFSSPGRIDQVPPTAQDAPPVVAGRNTGIAEYTSQGSLWHAGSKTFFRDPRARGVGDLLTVAVNLQNEAEFANQTNLQRQTGNGFSITGLGTLFGWMLPGLKNSNPNVSSTGNEQTNGQGDIKRKETLLINVATTVVQVLPNRNLEIAGSQEIRLNNELRELQIRGIVRPEDISSNNTITSDKIAEARIEYGGRGVSTDLQTPRWGQQILNRVQPF
jgi:flagellar L-ring protein precursor FlgH